MTPWISVTLESRSSTSSPIETFITEASTVMRNWATASRGRTSRPALVRSALASVVNGAVCPVPRVATTV